MNNKIILLWAICLIALGIVSKLASDDIKKQYETERARAEKDNFGKGDLVTHLLYASDWIALVLSTKQKSKEDLEALIHMIPGSEYQYFLKEKDSAQSLAAVVGCQSGGY